MRNADMAYRLISGAFHLFYQGARHVGSRPDGDSVWFEPDNPNHLDDIDGRDADLNGGGFAQLRFEGIDALELHYNGSHHQLIAPTVSARDTLLGLIGFNTITYAPSSSIPMSVRSASPHPIRGHILTRAIDPYGRPVAFAFTGNPAQADGSSVWLDTARLDVSLNAQLIAAGEVYPAFYTGLPSDLRDHLSNLAFDAWSANLGVWAVDRTNAGARVRNADDLSRLAIWPKLYRRLIKYFDDGHQGVGGFDAWLRADDDRDDELWIIPDAELGNLHDVIRVTGQNRITMTYYPEELVVVPG
jgi:hypothetical protein